ncbi:HAMP domain-containing protein [candidate division WOR-3 bacterium]|nr:HAMP domain-containing protein [candidate division WOR-3 bacterium]
MELKVIHFLKDKNYKELDSLIKNLGERIDTRITVINPEGVVLADSKKDPKLMENHATRPEVLKALYGKTGSSLRSSTTIKKEMLYVAIPVYEKGELLGILRVSLFLEQIKILLNSIRMNIVWVIVTIIILSLIGAFFFSKSLTNPITELVRASSKVAGGDFDVKIYLKGRDELQTLVDSFNNMIARIKELMTELAQQKDTLNAIITSIAEGLIVLDKKGKILLSNESFKKMVENPSVNGKLYWEVIRESKLSELIRDIEKEKCGIVREIEIKDRNYLCSITFLDGEEEFVLTLHDITEMHEMERIKKDFVVNVSHELRTPLTAIKGYMETLEESIDVENKRYVEIALRHTDRLIKIVKDLLALSELEESSFKLELEEVNLEKILSDILIIYENDIKDKELKLVFEYDKKLPTIKGDSYKLEQMFINLLENAIKYTDEGEIKITVKSEDKMVKIELSDTGIGIPEEHIHRIFERFYVVNKSHSRKLGGTGLGLSIVKHIVLLHNGTINVESTQGEGTTFIITLPI